MGIIKLINKIKKLTHNLRYLTTVDLHEDGLIDLVKKGLSKRVISDIAMMQNEALCEPEIKPNILNSYETLDYLLQNNVSFARFGDGEINIMYGGVACFQEYDPKLASRMKEIVKNHQPNLMVGICYSHFTKYNYTPDDTSYYIFWQLCMQPYYRKLILPYTDINTVYGDAHLTTINGHKDEKFYDKARKLWEGKEILVVGCKQLHDAITCDIYDNASKRDNLFVPNKNAFREYDAILAEIKKKSDKDTLIILMCGPTAKVLASDLTYDGYRALDMGHIAKAYDFIKKQIPQTGEIKIKFYSPDE